MRISGYRTGPGRLSSARRRWACLETAAQGSRGRERVDFVTDDADEPLWASWHPWAPAVNSGAFYELGAGASTSHVFRASYPNMAAHGAPNG